MNKISPPPLLIIGVGFIALTAPHAKAGEWVTDAINPLHLDEFRYLVESNPPGIQQPYLHEGQYNETPLTQINAVWRWEGDGTPTPIIGSKFSYTVSAINKADHSDGSAAWANAVTTFKVSGGPYFVSAYSHDNLPMVTTTANATNPGELSTDVTVRDNSYTDPNTNEQVLRFDSVFTLQIQARAYGYQERAGVGKIDARCGDADLSPVRLFAEYVRDGDGTLGGGGPRGRGGFPGD